MKGGKLFYLLKNLNPEEFKGLRKAIRSPFFGGTKKMEVLYEALRIAYPNFQNSEKYLKKLFQKTFGRERYDYVKLHKLFSALCRVIEEYILFSELRKEGVEQRKFQINIYSKRQMTVYFEKETEQLAQDLALTPFRDLEYYEAQVFLNNALYFNPLKDKYDVKDESLNLLTDNLDHYFTLAKMRYGASMKSRERILAKPGIWRFKEAFEAETAQGLMQDSVLFQLYQQAFLMLEEDENFDFEKYEGLLFEYIDQFRYDSKVLFFSGLNFVNRQINRGFSTFGRKAFEWYRFGLENELLLENGKLSEVTFGNIVICGCREKEFEWARKFMDKYAVYLKDHRKEEAVAYNIGLWHFYREDFENVYASFINYPFSFEYVGRARLTAIRALFELFLKDSDYFEVLISSIKSFENFINRDTKYAAHKWQPHLNCIRIIKKLAVLIIENKPKKEVKNWLENQLNSKKRIIAKSWLITKSEGL